jgi:hypothetical protein
MAYVRREFADVVFVAVGDAVEEEFYFGGAEVVGVLERGISV